MLRPPTIGEIGFGRVERKITVGDEELLRGRELTYEQLAAMPAANRNALIENRFISVFPKGVAVRRPDGQVPARVEIVEGASGEMHVIAKGFGRWDVIQGSIVASGLSKEAAEQLAGKSGATAAPVNLDAPPAAATSPRSKRKRKASVGRRLPPNPPGSPQNNGPVDE
jgi:hypothetical protein